MNIEHARAMILECKRKDSDPKGNPAVELMAMRTLCTTLCDELEATRAQLAEAQHG